MDKMLLRKRPRPSMRRTKSMTEFSSTEDFPAKVEEPSQRQPSDQEGAELHLHLRQQQRNQRRGTEAARRKAGVDWLEAGYHMWGTAPGRRNSGDFAVVETAPFLMACGLCKRRLGPGHDTFMYRGDIAFCSLECRQQHMNQEEQKEKCSLTSMKDTSPAPNGSKDSDSCGTAPAA